MNVTPGYVDGWSPSRLARIAGGLYLVNIVCGAFALGYVPAAAPTLAANPLLFRAGIAAHLIVVLTNPPLTLLFYELFKVVSRRLALMSALFGLVATAIEGTSLFVQVDHPVAPAYDVYTVFFAFELGTTAFLIVRSNFLPRRSADCSPSTPLHTSSIALRTSSHRVSLATLFRTSSCRSWPAKDPSACGCWLQA